MPEPTIKLTQDQIDFFHENGYLALDAITTQEEIDQLRDIYDRMFSSKAGRERGDQFDLAGTDDDDKEASLPQILKPELYAPEFRDTLMRANAVAIGKQLLGEEADGGGAHAIFKPARVGAETPWHQDEAYWDPSREHFSVSIWVPLQEATPENGCMHFVPGSHKWEVLPHHPIGHDPRVHGLELDEPAKYAKDYVACPLPPGGCTIHPGRTLHYTPPNRSDIPRRAYILGAAKPAKPRTEPRRFPWLEQRQTPREARAKAASNEGNEPQGAPQA